jgi:sorbose reductase
VKAKAYKCAVQNYEEVRDQVTTVLKDFGRLDVMVANAGMSIPAGTFNSDYFLKILADKM